MFYEIATQFIKDIPQYVRQMKDGIAKSDSSTIMESAHAIKGMVVIFSAQRTLQALTSVQASVGQLDCVTHVQALENEITHLVKAIQKTLMDQV